MLHTSAQSLIDYSSPYSMFRYSIRNELTRRYYERRLVRFFNYISWFPDSEIEKRCNAFAQNAKADSHWAMNRIIVFLQFQKDRSNQANTR